MGSPADFLGWPGNTSSTPASSPTSPFTDWDNYAMRVAQLESGGNPNAPQSWNGSSALGLGQFVKGTWGNLMRQTNPQYASASDDDLAPLRTNGPLSLKMIAAYGQQNAPTLQQAGIPINSASLYAAHFLGPGGAAKVLSAPSSSQLSDLLSPQAMTANPQLKGLTAGDFANMVSKKMGSTMGSNPPSAALNPNDPQMSLDPVNVSATADPTTTSSPLDALFNGKNMGFNPAKLLSSMAAGFLGGNGGAQSLSKGFGGAATSLNQDQEQSASLQRMQMMFGSQSAQRMAALIRGGVPASMAAKITNTPLSPTDAAALDANMNSQKAMPAAYGKQVAAGVDGVRADRNLQVQLKTVSDWAKNGDFQLDPLHRALYETELAAGNPTGNDAAQKYQAFKQTVALAGAGVLNMLPGEKTDAKMQQAMTMVQGGPGAFTNNDAVVNHFHALGNAAALSEMGHRQLITNAFQMAHQNAPDVDKMIGPLQPSPYQGVNVNSLGTNIYGDNTTNPAATAPPGQPLGGPTAAPAAAPSSAVGIPGVTKSGVKYIIIGQPQQ